MAVYTANSAKHQTLTISTVDTVTLSAAGRRILIVNRDAAGLIYVTAGGPTAGNVADPTVAGDNTYVILPNTTLALPYPLNVGAATGQVSVKLISAAAAAYSVQIATDRTGS